MEPWGASLFGDPCDECGFDWSVTTSDALRWMDQAPDRFLAATHLAEGSERRAGWSVSEYVSHVGDNLRQWAERVQGARLAGQAEVAGYDPDALGAARSYAAIPLPAALWSLESSVGTWTVVLRLAVAEGVELLHATRGLQRAEDVVRNNTHDAHHHLWDVVTILGQPDAAVSWR